jgi:hypothetical protein
MQAKTTSKSLIKYTLLHHDLTPTHGVTDFGFSTQEAKFCADKALTDDVT